MGAFNAGRRTWADDVIYVQMDPRRAAANSEQAGVSNK
jgi:hypothetical protein